MNELEQFTGIIKSLYKYDSVIVKNKHAQYVYMSIKHEQRLGMKDSSQYLGKTAIELNRSKLLNHFHDGSQMVLATADEHRLVGIYETAFGNETLYSVQYPIFNKDRQEIIGVLIKIHSIQLDTIFAKLFINRLKDKQPQLDSFKIVTISNFKLSLRENEVLFFLLLKFTESEISELYYKYFNQAISIHAVKTYIRRIYAKLNIHDKEKLLEFAYNNNMHQNIPYSLFMNKHSVVKV